MFQEISAEDLPYVAKTPKRNDLGKSGRKFPKERALNEQLGVWKQGRYLAAKLGIRTFTIEYILLGLLLDQLIFFYAGRFKISLIFLFKKCVFMFGIEKENVDFFFIFMSTSFEFEYLNVLKLKILFFFRNLCAKLVNKTLPSY